MLMQCKSNYASLTPWVLHNACWPFHVGDGGDLVRVRFDTSSTDDVAQQYTGWNSKDALWRVQLPSVLVQVREGFFEVSDKVVGCLSLDDHIIDVGFDVTVDLLVEAHLDGPLIGSPDILESEGHSFVAVCTERRDEWRLDLVVFLKRYLVIARVTIEEGEQFTAGGGVYNLVYPR